MISAVRKSASNYREELMTAKLTLALRTEPNNKPESDEKEKCQDLEKEKKLLDKQKDLENRMKEAEILIEEGTNRLEGALKNGSLTEAHAAKLLIVGGRERLVDVNEQQRQVTNDLEKFRLKRKDALSHQQSANKKFKSM